MRPGVVIADRFVLADRIGSGAMGLVFKATDRATSTFVALKLLISTEPEDEARFARECELHAAIDAPGIVKYIAHGAVAGERPHLAMEWVDGVTLGKRLREAPLDVASTVRLVSRVSQAVATLHDKAIVHRDIKPANIMLAGGDSNEPKLLDFGVAFSSRAPDGLSAPGVMVGSPGYMAPEQARGEVDVDVRADVFALGCLVFKCLTGNTPFHGDVVTVLLKLAIEECPRLSERAAKIPPVLDEIVGRMLSRDRDERPRDATEVARVFGRISEHDLEVRPSRNPPVLTSSEMRVSSVVIGRLRPGNHRGVDPRELLPALVRELAEARSRLDVLADGTLAVTLDEPYDSASDLATRGLRAALAIRATFPDVQVVVATGRAIDAGRTLIGQVIERASSMLAEVNARGHRGMIVLDSTTMHLAEKHFVVLPWSTGGRLIGERAVEVVRDLLGKPTPFVGRARELGHLSDLARQTARDAAARAVLVVAPAGIGKSRLRAELCAELDGAQIDVWIARGDPMTQKAPFGLLSQLVRRAAGVVHGESSEERWSKLRSSVERSLAMANPQSREAGGASPGGDGPRDAEVERVSDFLGELTGIERPSAPSLELSAARRDRGLMGDQMRRAFVDFVAAALDAAPLAIVVEDVQWGDLPSLTFLGAVLRQLANRPLFVLGVGRPDLDPAVVTAWGEARFERLDLSALERSAATELVRSALRGTGAEASVDAVVSRADGNAFFLEELARAVAEGGGHVLPETILATVEARLDSLPVDTRRVLRAASMFGQRTWEGAIRALVGIRDLRKHLTELVEREILSRELESRFEGETEYAFRNAVVAETAYAMLADEDRVRGHAVIAGWLSARGESEPSVLAEHLERGGAPERALELWALSAERALAGQDLEGAMAFAQRGLRAASTGPLVGRLRAAFAEALSWRGSNADSARQAALAMAELEPGSDEWCGAATTGVTGAGRTGDRAEVLAIVERILGLPQTDERRTAHVVLLAQCAIQMVFAGQLGLADDLLARMDRVEDERLDPRALAWAYRALAWRAITAGDPGAYGMLMQRSADRFGELGDLRNQCVQRVNVAYAALGVGALEASVKGFYEVIETTTAFGIDTVTSVARHNLGYALALLGELENAELEERRALDAFVAHGDLRMQGTTHTYLALIAMLRGDPTVALAEARAALALSTQEGPSRAIALATLASVLLAAGQELAEALPRARQAMMTLEELGGVDEGEALIRLTYARCLRATGDVSGARRAILRARDRLRERAERIHPESLRPSFLERLPDHRLTLALAEEWIE